MHETKRTPAGDALSELILDLFRLNSRILAAGDRLVADIGLTSARWQTLGAIVTAERPQPVAWLARDLGAPTAKMCNGSSTTCTRKGSSRLNPTRIIGGRNWSF
jgi:hypothetical protein